MDYKEVKACRICKGNNLEEYLDLGNVPLCNKLASSDNELSAKYPIKVLVCKDCWLSQLSIVVAPTILYNNYPYHSSVSRTFQEHCYNLACTLKEYNPTAYPMGDYKMVVDIASNDNCLLKQFRRAGGYTVYGVEPSDSFKPDYSKYSPESSEDVIPVAHTFWSSTCLDHTDMEGKPHFITALNVFAHVDDLDEFMRGIVKYISADGIFVVEVPYLPNLIRNCEFDTIYHEHLNYFLLKPLVRLFNLHDMKIFKVEKLDIHGGSIRIYASKKYYEQDGSVAEMLNNEGARGYYSIETYTTFKSKVDYLRDKLRMTLELLFLGDKKVMGYGASAKGISLMNYCEIERKHIHSIVDETPAKQNKMTPGSHIDIFPFDEFDKQKPDYILLLAWNFKDELIAKTKHLGAKYIIPIPDVRTI